MINYLNLIELKAIYPFSCKELTSSLVLYGHTARVWKVLWTPLHLLTIGEDATCRIWDHQGHCYNVITGHKVI